MHTVLVVEDNRDNARIITYALKRAGYAVRVAGTGEEAVDLAVEQRPFFILMDINLPGIDGIEATRRIRSSSTDGKIPIIAITSFALAGDRERILAAGCTGYIEKPIDPITIIDQLHRIIGLTGNEDPHR